MKFFKNLSFAFFVGALCLFAGCSGADSSSSNGLSGQVIKTAIRDDFDSMLESGDYVLIDVRTKAEFDAGHIDGAKLIDFRSVEFKDEISKLDKDEKYLIYCRSGARSKSALAVFKSLGFEEVYDLKGGFSNYN